MAAITTYPARYKDRFGEEQTTIENDGETLTMVVRGVQFEGNAFDDFEPRHPQESGQLSTFSLSLGNLCSCVIEADIPIPIETPDGIVDGVLTCEIELGEPSPTGQFDREQLTLHLEVGGHSFSSHGTSGWFEDEMLDLQRQLSPSMLMKACINCAFSDYSPYGHGFFGGLACFRGNKEGYRAVTSKHDLFALWHSLTEFVQETHLCPAFERRVPGTGYRG